MILNFSHVKIRTDGKIWMEVLGWCGTTVLLCNFSRWTWPNFPKSSLCLWQLCRKQKHHPSFPKSKSCWVVLQWRIPPKLSPAEDQSLMSSSIWTASYSVISSNTCPTSSPPFNLLPLPLRSSHSSTLAVVVFELFPHILTYHISIHSSRIHTHIFMRTHVVASFVVFRFARCPASIKFMDPPCMYMCVSTSSLEIFTWSFFFINLWTNFSR